MCLFHQDLGDVPLPLIPYYQKLLRQERELLELIYELDLWENRRPEYLHKQAMKKLHVGIIGYDLNTKDIIHEKLSILQLRQYCTAIAAAITRIAQGDSYPANAMEYEVKRVLNGEIPLIE
ncbi:MAG: hypothetical protein F6K50_02855 [Moorea sp. SIO3I7]|uniref:hypothetical protein n=1 Tax=Moorena sp. SIO3I8 TaxID=2607833 RepID=UPI0013C277B4|nr:hypothetical protein [Moorena sp. SIO3I8]NEN94502.1 hypothetical protein [Moorena sp. SIO3I7]NEO04913.1 hypothetical protein [Moorena sp. SIO3I8]